MPQEKTLHAIQEEKKASKRDCPSCKKESAMSYNAYTVYRVIDPDSKEVFMTGDGWHCDECKSQHLFDDDTDPRDRLVKEIKEDRPQYETDNCYYCRNGSSVYSQRVLSVRRDKNDQEIAYYHPGSYCWFCHAVFVRGGECCSMTIEQFAKNPPKELKSVKEVVEKHMAHYEISKEDVSKVSGVSVTELASVLNGDHVGLEACMRLSVFMEFGQQYLASLQSACEQREMIRGSSYEATCVDTWQEHQWRQEDKKNNTFPTKEEMKANRKKGKKRFLDGLQDNLVTLRYFKVEGWVEEDDGEFVFYRHDKEEGDVIDGSSYDKVYANIEQGIKGTLTEVPFYFDLSVKDDIYTNPHVKIIYGFEKLNISST